MRHTKCTICGKTGIHYHERKILTDEFIPTAELTICHCGRVDEHIHTTTQLVLFEDGKLKKKQKV